MSQEEGCHAADEGLEAREQQEGVSGKAQQLGQEEQFDATGLHAARCRQRGDGQEGKQGGFHRAGNGQALHFTINVYRCCCQEKEGGNNPEKTFCFHEHVVYHHKNKKSLVICQKIRIFAVPSFVTEPGPSLGAFLSL